MTNTEKVRLVQEDKMVWWEILWSARGFGEN